MQVLPLRDVLVSDSRLCTGIIFTRQGEQDVKEEEARKQKVTPPTHLQIPFNFFGERDPQDNQSVIHMPVKRMLRRERGSHMSAGNLQKMIVSDSHRLSAPENVWCSRAGQN